MRRLLLIPALALGGMLAASVCSLGGEPCASCGTAAKAESATPACPPQKIVVETPPPQVIFQQAAAPSGGFLRCCHFGCRQANVVTTVPAAQSYAPTMMPMAVQAASVPMMAAPSYSVAPSFSMAPMAAPSYSMAPMAAPSFSVAPSYSFAPTAMPSFAMPSYSAGAAPYGLQAAPAFSLPITFALPQSAAPQAAGAQAVGAQATGRDTSEMRLDDALRKVSTSLDKLGQIAEIHTTALEEHERRLKILECATNQWADQDAKFKAILDKCKADNPRPK